MTETETFTLPANKVYRIDDSGEGTVIAAASMVDALTLYFANVGEEDGSDGIGISVIEESTELGVAWTEDDPGEMDVPEGGKIIGVRDGKGAYPRVVATASQWASHTTQNIVAELRRKGCRFEDLAIWQRAAVISTTIQ